MGVSTVWQPLGLERNQLTQAYVWLLKFKLIKIFSSSVTPATFQELNSHIQLLATTFSLLQEVLFDSVALDN